jgi:hypothetical protein
MERAEWALRTLSGTALVPYLAVLFMVLVLCWDYPLLVPYFLACRALGRSPYGRSDGARALPLLVVIPSLLRQRDELTSMMSTVESVATNRANWSSSSRSTGRMMHRTSTTNCSRGQGVSVGTIAPAFT